MFEQSWDAAAIGRKVQRIRALLPKAEVAGITHYDNLNPEEIGSERSILSVLLFERPGFSLLRFPLTGRTDEEVGVELGAQVGALEDVRCVMTLFSRQRRDIEAILTRAQRQWKDIPVLGASAGMRELFQLDDTLGYVFDAQGCDSDALLAVAFHGAQPAVRPSCSARLPGTSRHIGSFVRRPCSSGRSGTVGCNAGLPEAASAGYCHQSNGTGAGADPLSSCDDVQCADCGGIHFE